MWAEIFPIDGFVPLVVRNVSRTGMAGEADVPLSTGQRLVFSISENAFHVGTIRWARGRRFGMDLENALAIFGIENETDRGSSPSHRPRAKRYDIEVEGRVVVGAAPFRSTVRDVSQSGLRLDSVPDMPLGQQVLVQVRDRPLMLAEIRWALNGAAGVKTADRMNTLRLAYAYE
ncbi:PilZ domain-containing protein [Sphingomonas tabacisoli]|uniref:PilZ domain-containing protein n=1 Tax=Sphingomonas tabacisoli TaxID=2249466 RepID=A0ABW4HZ73_9SPHN